MEPTFDEMRPILKNIRDKLTALTLKKTAPKERNKVVGKGKENELSSSITNLSLIDDTSGGKAGKTVYPILVGETTNLFKTRQLRLSKISTVTTLDLHGCSRYKALGLLRKSLVEWVDKTMKGDYVRYFLLDSFYSSMIFISILSLCFCILPQPFVIAVDIICGETKSCLNSLLNSFVIIPRLRIDQRVSVDM